MWSCLIDCATCTCTCRYTHVHLIHCTYTLYDTFVGAKSSYPSSGLVESLCTHFKLDTSVHVVVDKKILKEGRNRNVHIIYPYLLCTGYSFVELIHVATLYMYINYKPFAFDPRCRYPYCMELDFCWWSP